MALPNSRPSAPNGPAAREGGPLVSVIVPIFNGERFLGDTLESVCNQSYQPLELIVVDDGSTDDSEAAARRFPRARYLRQDHEGVAAARNRGIKLARGEYLAFLDQDDLWLPDKLTLQVQALEDDPTLDVVITLEKFFLEPGTQAPDWVRREAFESGVTAHEPSALLVRAGVFASVGLFDPAFAHTSDADWFFRVRDQGIPIRVLDRVLVLRRIHAGNMSHSPAVTQELRQVTLASIRRKRERARGTSDGTDLSRKEPST